MRTAIGWQSCGRTDVGMVRELNEDAFLERAEIGLWVVADGMGGHTAGDVASHMICDRLAAIERPAGLAPFVDEVEERLLAVNAELRAIAARREARTVGSTVVALLAHGEHAVCLWAGDSRAYLYRHGTLIAVSEDHGLVSELVAKGMLSVEEARDHPQANLITRAVGAADTLFLDAEIVELLPEDRWLLCSDGLDKEVSAAEIAEILAAEPGAPYCDLLVDLALSRGARDNVTVVAITVHEGEPGETADGRSEETTCPGAAARRAR